MAEHPCDAPVVAELEELEAQVVRLEGELAEARSKPVCRSKVHCLCRYAAASRVEAAENRLTKALAANAAKDAALRAWANGYSVNEMKGFACRDGCDHSGCARWRLTIAALSGTQTGTAGEGMKVQKPLDSVGWLGVGAHGEVIDLRSQYPGRWQNWDGWPEVREQVVDMRDYLIHRKDCQLRQRGSCGYCASLLHRAEKAALDALKVL